MSSFFYFITYSLFINFRVIIIIAIIIDNIYRR